MPSPTDLAPLHKAPRVVAQQQRARPPPDPRLSQHQRPEPASQTAPEKTGSPGWIRSIAVHPPQTNQYYSRGRNRKYLNIPAWVLTYYYQVRSQVAFACLSLAKQKGSCTRYGGKNPWHNNGQVSITFPPECAISNAIYYISNYCIQPCPFTSQNVQKLLILAVFT